MKNNIKSILAIFSGMLLVSSSFANSIAQAKDKGFTQASSSIAQSAKAKAASAKFVSVPSNYVYDTSGRSGPVSRHDYCTKSPDEFPNPIGKNANFRGPCARHDMCYDSRTDKKKCDMQLLLDMRSNCKYTYSNFISPTRKACYRTAGVYFAAVVAAM